MSKAKQFYKHHVFVCTNKRESNMACADFESQSARDYLKAQMKKKGLYGEGGVRIGQSGCLGRCLSGPVMVVYPAGVWYTYVDKEDLDEIMNSHLLNDKVVKRLLIKA